MTAIICDYVDRLDERLVQMGAMCQNGRFDELAAEAHWLKGSGGTVGYAEFSKPANALEQAAKRAAIDEAKQSLVDIIDVRSRLVLPERAEAT